MSIEFDLMPRPAWLVGSDLSTSVICPDCSEPADVEWITPESGGSYPCSKCSKCGIEPLSPDTLQNWEIQIGPFLDWLIELCGISGNRTLVVEGDLWLLGRARWAGRLRQVFYVRGWDALESEEIARQLDRHPKAVVILPTEKDILRWERQFQMKYLAIESMVVWNRKWIFNDEYVTECLADQAVSNESKHPKPKKRGERTAKIGLLEKVLTEHLLRARDHAFFTQEKYGEAQLLRRPTQKQLGELASLNESDVSRCLRDKTALKLQLLWTTANDLDRIMKYGGK